MRQKILMTFALLLAIAQGDSPRVSKIYSVKDLLKL